MIGIKMDIKNLKRDPEYVGKALRENDTVLYAAKTVRIYAPVRFTERNLGSMYPEITIVGIFAIVVDDRFAVMNIPAIMPLSPTVFNTVQINKEDYYEYVFEPGSVIIPNLDLVRTKTLVYYIYDEIISKGKIPWYLDYAGLASVFDYSKEFANVSVGSDHEVTELLVSLIARNKDDRKIYYRQSVKTVEEIQSNPPAYIPMRSVIYAATNTLNKIAGSYMESGIVSALVSPSERSENIESLLRS